MATTAATSTTSSDVTAYVGNNTKVMICYDTTNGKVGFFGTTPCAQQTGYAALSTTGASTTASISEIQTDLNLIRTLLITYGLATTV